MKTLKLDFQKGVSPSMDNDRSVNGLYIVYAGEKTSTDITIKKIIYIGMSTDLSDRANDNSREDDQKKWERYCENGETLWYKLAFVKTENGDAAKLEDVKRAENALIFQCQPVCNKQGKEKMNYEDTHIICIGAMHKLIDDNFTVYKTTKKLFKFRLSEGI